jgi:ABC-type transporter Mla subunit MlaD
MENPDLAASPDGSPWAGATLPDIGQLTQQASRIASDIGLITNRISGALDTAAIDDVRKSLRDLRIAADRLADFARKQSGPFSDVTKNLAVTSAEVGEASKKVNILLDRADSATNDGQATDIMNAARETSRARTARTVEAVQQPVVDARGPVKPDCVIDARHHQVAAQERGSVRHRRCVEQPIVRDVRQQAEMQRFVIG